MNEEMKIIIKAVTDSAQKAIKEVSGELNNLSKSAKGSSGKVSAALKGIAKGAAIAVAAISAIVTALVVLGKRTLEFQKEQAKLNAAFLAAGASAEQAAEAYNGLYRFLGDSGKATEAASHLAKITTNQQNLAEWTKIAQGVYATFGDSLPIESLTEAANETIRVGKVTGTLADALNWAGVSEDEFNAKLAQTNSLSEREALLRSTLNGLYQNAAEIYERNNKAILDYNESQARLDSSMAAAGAAITPLLTALNNLGSAFFTALKPALDVIVPALVTFVNWITKGIEAVTSFFSALTGKSTAIKAVSNINAGIGSAAGNTGNLSSGLDDVADAAGGAEKAIEDAKKATMGFDELNIVPSGKTASSGSGGSGGGGGGSSSPGYGTGGSGGMSDFSTEVEEGEETASRFDKIFEQIGNAIEKVKTVFAPSIEAWSDGFETIKQAINNAIPHVLNGLDSFWQGFKNIGSYLVNEFVPNVVNSFSVNLAPVITDVLGFAIEEVAKDFEFLGSIFESVSEDIIVPTLQTIETIATDIFDSIGNAWEERGAPLLENLSTAFESFRTMLNDFYENLIKPVFEKVNKAIETVWTEGLGPLVAEFVDAVLEIGSCLLDLYNTYLAPVVSWILNKIYPQIVNVVDRILKVVTGVLTGISNTIEGVIRIIKGIVQFITGVFTGDWEKAWEGVKNIFDGVWTAIGGIAKTAWSLIQAVFEPVVSFFTNIWTNVKKIYEPAAQWFKEIFGKAWQGIQSAWSSVTTWFSGIWTKITNVFSPVKTWFTNTFSNAWKAVQNVFSNWGSFFSGLWNRIKTTFSNLGTSISNAIGSAVKSGINGVISMIENTINSAINLINGAIRLINKIPGVSVSTISRLSLPRLAKGGIVDSATIAMIGEQGKEAVVPLENNTEWMDKLAERIAARSNTPTKIVLKVGEKELGWATIDAINGITRQTGGLQLAL